MTETEIRIYLINYLKNEDSTLKDIEIPNDKLGQERVIRALMNIRPSKPISKEFLDIQNIYLTNKAKEKGIVYLDELKPYSNSIYLWQGDITRLSVDSIVNAANPTLLGCFHPCHNCIDNVIHSYSGIELRLECNEIIREQGREEKVGNAKITRAYNLPSKYIIHTVGPIINGEITKADRSLLASCYKACLMLADEKGLKSIAFPCISTGEFHFPNNEASDIAINTALTFKKRNNSNIKIIFNVFKDIDYKLYKEKLENI